MELARFARCHLLLDSFGPGCFQCLRLFADTLHLQQSLPLLRVVETCSKHAPSAVRSRKAKASRRGCCSKGPRGAEGPSSRESSWEVVLGHCPVRCDEVCVFLFLKEFLRHSELFLLRNHSSAQINHSIRKLTEDEQVLSSVGGHFDHFDPTPAHFCLCKGPWRIRMNSSSSSKILTGRRRSPCSHGRRAARQIWHLPSHDFSIFLITHACNN